MKWEKHISRNRPYSILVCGTTNRSKVNAALALWNAGLNVRYSDSDDEIQHLLLSQPPSLLLLDFDANTIDPLTLLEFVRNKGLTPAITSIGFTESSHLKPLFQASRMGMKTAANIKSNISELRQAIQDAYEAWQNKSEAQELFQSQKSKYEFTNIVGDSPQMQRVFQLISKIIKRKWATVLIRGETGTGKELIARSIHYHTCESDQPFVEINCSALPESLLESELFGYEKGAFTDAKISKAGLFELAHNGTLFLDEIGEITPKVQIKLLKALEEKTIRRLGGTKDIRINTRIITATNRNLQAAIKEGTFRQDLFYRLNVLHIDVPPLRERENDVLLLAEHFLKEFAEEYDCPLESFSPDAERLIQQYPWPGNVRELRHTIERITLLSEGKQITRNELEQTIDSETPIWLSELQEAKQFHVDIPPHGVSLEEAEKAVIQEILRRSGWNKRRTCRILKISRPRLDRKIQLYNLRPPE